VVAEVEVAAEVEELAMEVVVPGAVLDEDAQL
jgi:hypothetical protein